MRNEDETPINIKLINDELISFAIYVLGFTMEEVEQFTLEQWEKVLGKYED